jgi:hypothetical protein
MEMIIEKGAFQLVKCIKDNNSYMYKVDENPWILEEEYSLIKCFRIQNGIPDFTKEIEIYGKDLVIQ